MRVSSPPFRYPCFFGTDVDSRENLVACRLHSVEEIAEEIGADSLAYLSVGAARVILGTSAVENFAFLTDMVKKYGDKIAVGVDIKNGGVATNSVKTTARIWEEGGALKFEIVCEEPSMEKRHARRRADDATCIWSEDNVETMLNPTGDRDVYYHFIVNSAGTMTDIKHVVHLRRGGNEVAWNAGATVAVAALADSWKIELSIPLAALEGLREDRFPAEIVRQRRLKGRADEVFRWSPYSRSNLDIVNYGAFVRK